MITHRATGPPVYPSVSKQPQDHCANRLRNFYEKFNAIKQLTNAHNARKTQLYASELNLIIDFDNIRLSSVSFRAFGSVIQGKLRVATKSERDRRQIHESRSV
ncbi:PREDICTED: uncharacterized protein LOC105144904 [Acromyrmex echinatior]|uniref:uncharacterized protein LOC105144904 n=1 Tax=Acromyrmex echinatior TaxID=103372 RepID=UPI000580F6EE|nr:PREDICTED: uncharacterized protein LOC105144904 [Acromyrmex echinatior]